MSHRTPYGRKKKNFKSVAIPIMAGNHHPTTADVSHGMKRRTYVVPFNRIFEPHEQKLGLIDDIMTERSGVLNRLLEGYLRLVNRNYRFDEPGECDEARQLFFEESHPLRDFIKYRCESAPNEKIRLDTFRKVAKQYVEEVGTSVTGLGNKLKANLATLGYADRRGVRNIRVNEACFAAPVANLHNRVFGAFIDVTDDQLPVPRKPELSRGQSPRLLP